MYVEYLIAFIFGFLAIGAVFCFGLLIYNIIELARDGSEHFRILMLILFAITVTGYFIKQTDWFKEMIVNDKKECMQWRIK